MAKRTLFLSALATLILHCTPSFADFLLDDVMNKETQNQTGVSKLSYKQKKILEAWLNEKFQLKTAEQETKGRELLLSINLNGGRRLQLYDGSIWEIDPSDLTQSSAWITPFAVQIEKSTSADYPTLLVNKDTGASVKARRIMTTQDADQPPPPIPSIQTETITPGKPAS